MPIEIRELVIRAFVDSSNAQKKLFSKRDKEAPIKLIQASVDQLVEIIKQEKER